MQMIPNGGQQVRNKEMKQRSALNSLRQSKQANSCTFSAQEFSFNDKRETDRMIVLKQKYLDLYNDLKSMNTYDLVDLVLEQLEENERYKREAAQAKDRIRVAEQQNFSLRSLIKQKEEAIQLLCQSEQNNIRILQKLQTHIQTGGSKSKEKNYQKKYRQLSKYMNEYISSMNEAQDEFKRTYVCLKDENNRLLSRISILNEQNRTMKQQIELLKSKFQKPQISLQQFSAKNNSCHFFIEDNEGKQKQTECEYNNAKISDRLESRISFDQQPSNDFDFIGEKQCDNGRQTISKFQGGSIKEQSKDENSKILQQKVFVLNKEIESLKEHNDRLQKQVKNLEKEKKKILDENQQLDDALLLQKTQKEIIRREFLNISQKVRLVQPIYNKQVQQSTKIHNDLFLLKENKYKKEDSLKGMSCQVLGEISMNECLFSNSTFSNSVKHSFQKKGKEEISLSFNEKENISHIQEQDSLTH